MGKLPSVLERDKRLRQSLVCVSLCHLSALLLVRRLPFVDTIAQFHFITNSSSRFAPFLFSILVSPPKFRRTLRDRQPLGACGVPKRRVCSIMSYNADFFETFQPKEKCQSRKAALGCIWPVLDCKNGNKNGKRNGKKNGSFAQLDGLNLNSKRLNLYHFGEAQTSNSCGQPFSCPPAKQEQLNLLLRQAGQLLLLLLSLEAGELVSCKQTSLAQGGLSLLGCSKRWH